MSARNLEIVRRIYGGIDRGDPDAVLSLYDADVEWIFTRSPFRELFKHDVYRGHEGLRSFIRERYEDAWATIKDELEELIDAGDHVISIVTSRGRGRASGAEVEKTHAGLWTLRDGKVVRVEWMGDRESALAAAGLADGSETNDQWGSG